MASNLNLKLTHSDIKNLNIRHPPSKASNAIGDRAVEIVRLYFNKNFPGSMLTVVSPSSSNCRVQHSNGTIEEFLVKGTGAS